ncbi:MAG: aminotransferase class I/II-fold pyridoxal phosphate-dependent enzyme [Defluviitaleaceae bacterium]|nr:aminotransferase class I/II-fold pyridoxal phosphate-dependent enzyme [Defluviitaleaceae bacterium]
MTDRRARYKECLALYNEYKERGLSISMARGKPNGEQLKLSNGLLSVLAGEGCVAADGTDCRNYGGTDGLPEMRRLFAEIMAVNEKNVIVGGNSSLGMMYDCIADMRGIWPKNAVFICPVPGYDRHHNICEHFGIQMVTVNMTHEGPDMDAVEALAVSDASVVGMWCVPVFSNPQGYIYSDETVRRLACLKTAAKEKFRLFWDNAYCVHHFRGNPPAPVNFLKKCADAGNEDMPIIFTSFSKISFAGAGVAALAASEKNLEQIRKRLFVQTVGPDKLNQLRHAKYFKDIEGINAHMRKHAEIIRPKFELAHFILDENLRGKGVARWHCPDGGYFMSLNTLQGRAKRTVRLCAEAGIEFTAAGSTYPYKNDPNDANIRIAPTYPTLSELSDAMRIFCLAVEVAALES